MTLVAYISGFFISVFFFIISGGFISGIILSPNEID